MDDHLVELRLNESDSETPELLTAGSLPMPSDRTNNFWYVKNTSDTVVVFIHGIFSSSRTCWLYDDPKTQRRVFWPDLVRTDLRLENPSIFLAGFHTGLEAGDFALAECSAEAFAALERPDLDGTASALSRKRIIFICHSTGGLVIRYVLERNREIFRDKEVGLVLMASPSLGSAWANFLSFFAQVLNLNQQLGQQLRTDNETVRELNARFRDLVNRKGALMPFLYGMEACEHKPLLRTTVLRFVLWVLPNRGKIVSKLSAGQFFGSVTQIPDTDHSSIVKPDRFNHPSHDFLVTFYLRFRAFLNEKGVTPVHAEDVRSPDATDDLALKIASIRRGLLSARNLYELRECRAQALSLMEERPNQPDLRLLLEQIEDAIAVEQEHAESAVQRKLRLSGAGVTMLALLIAALIIGPGQIHKAFTGAMNSFRGSPDVFITATSIEDRSERCDPEDTRCRIENQALVVSGRLSRPVTKDHVYVLYQSKADTWLASEATVASDGSWTASLGTWGNVARNKANKGLELRAFVSPHRISEVTSTPTGEIRVPDEGVSQIFGKKASQPYHVDLEKIAPLGRVSIDFPQDNSVVTADQEFVASGKVGGLRGNVCVYLLHRTPYVPNDWAIHPAQLAGDGTWSVHLGRFGGHQLIRPGFNELMAIIVPSQWCGTLGDGNAVREGGLDVAAESGLISTSPVVEIKVEDSHPGH